MDENIRPLRLKLAKNKRIELTKDDEFKTLLITVVKFIPIDDLKYHSNYKIVRKFKFGALIINMSYYKEETFFIMIKYFLSNNEKQFEKVMKYGCQIKIFTE